MTIPDIDLNELKEQKQKNFTERLKFIDEYSKWVKKTDNKTWSSQQKKIID